jgi:GNAT superfamily N-acetyltransferase
MSHEERRGAYLVSDDAARLDVDAVHGFISGSYWGNGIPRETVRRSMEGSLCFGVYHERDGQVGFARAITDRATFAYLADVYVVDAHRGQGLGVWLVDFVLRHPELQGLRRWMLMTKDAHSLYARFGFGPLTDPSHAMARRDPDVYRR